MGNVVNLSSEAAKRDRKGHERMHAEEASRQRVLDFRLEALILLEAYADIPTRELLSELTGLAIVVETGLHRKPKGS